MSWAAEMKAVQSEAGGLMSLHVIRPEDTHALLLRIIQGDPEAEQISGALWDTLKRIKGAPRHTPMLCASCPRPVRRDNFAVVLATPEVANPERCLGLAICSRCATTPDAIRDKAVQALRRIWPDARPVTIHPTQAGRA